MAAITGWIDWDRDLTPEGPTLSRMAASLSHRGPDGEGAFLSTHAGLAHRRIDRLETPQPFRLEISGAPLALGFDGALENAEALRRELEGLGQRFESSSAAEVILRGYLQWGGDVAAHLAGMFAVAIWDGRRGEAWLLRDRVGIKPLYYVAEGRRLLFASEPKGLLAHPEVRARVDELGLAELFALPFAKTPGVVPFGGMNELPPAHALRFDRDGARLVRYWQIESRPHADDLETTAATVRSLLTEAIRRYLEGEASVSTLLSGGLDSSGVTAIAARILETESRGPVEAYAVEMRDAGKWFEPTAIQPELDSVYAQKMADHLKASFRMLTLDADDVLGAFFAPLEARDLPSMGEMDASLYLLCRLIKEQHDVVLSGESADEIFGGYPFFFDEKACAAETFPWMVETVSYRPDELLREEIRGRIFADDYVKQRYREALSEVPRLASDSPEEARMREVFYLVRSRFLPILIDRKDRMSMASGLQARMPFSDHRLHEYMWNVPWAMKCHRGREKGLLRKAFEGILPDDVLWRKKSGYPSMHDPAFTRAIQAKLARKLDDASSPMLALVDAEKVRRRLEEAASHPSAGGIGGHNHLFAYLLQVDEWLARYQVDIVI